MCFFHHDCWLGGFLVQKSIRGHAAEMHGSQNQPPGIMMTPCSVQKTGINMGHIFKIFLNWSENRPNFINLIP